MAAVSVSASLGYSWILQFIKAFGNSFKVKFGI